MKVTAFLPILNGIFATANIDVVIVEWVILQEQIVIGSPPVESLEKELKVIEETTDIETGGRYMVTGVLASQGRNIPIFVRFYITTDGKLRIEDFTDNGSTLMSADEFKKPDAWKKVIEYVVSWGPVIVKILLSYFSITSGDA